MSMEDNVKKGLKKNHIMIGALTLMIAVAGYLNFSADKVSDRTLASISTQDNTIYDLSEEDIAKAETEDNLVLPDTLEQQLSTQDLLMNENYMVTNADAESMDFLNTELNSQDFISLDEPEASHTDNYIDEEMAELFDEMEVYEDEEVAANSEDVALSGEINDMLDTAQLTIDEIPGEAVFTAGNSITSLASARLLKEQTRARNRETFMAVINSMSADEASKQQATDGILDLTKRAEKEAAAEILLEAKGYPEVVVSIEENSADVVVGMSNLTSDQCAQIIDAVARKTDIPASNIVITPAGVSK